MARGRVSPRRRPSEAVGAERWFSRAVEYDEMCAAATTYGIRTVGLRREKINVSSLTHADFSFFFFPYQILLKNEKTIYDPSTLFVRRFYNGNCTFKDKL